MSAVECVPAFTTMHPYLKQKNTRGSKFTLHCNNVSQISIINISKLYCSFIGPEYAPKIIQGPAGTRRQRGPVDISAVNIISIKSLNMQRAPVEKKKVIKVHINFSLLYMCIYECLAF